MCTMSIQLMQLPAKVTHGDGHHTSLLNLEFVANVRGILASVPHVPCGLHIC